MKTPARPKKSPSKSEPRSAPSRKTEPLQWEQFQDKDQWTSSRIPDGECMAVRIRRSSKNTDGSYTFFVYRDSRYLDCASSLDEAKAIAESGKMRPERILSIDRVRRYIKDSTAQADGVPRDVEAFKKLPKLEQDALRQTFPHLCPRSSTLHLDREGKGGGTREKSELKAAATPASRAATSKYSPDAVIRVVSAANPFRAGTGQHARWENLVRFKDKPVREYMAGGGLNVTLSHCVSKGWVKVENV